MRDVLKEGDKIPVKVLEVDRQGKIRLSLKEARREQQDRERRAEFERAASRTTRLENGLRVVTETVRDVSVGGGRIWVDTGLEHEDERIDRRRAFRRAPAVQGDARRVRRRRSPRRSRRRGGTINAFTDKEYTCYHARALAEQAPSLDVLSDLVLHAEPRTEDIELEREVIIQEILDVEDRPGRFPSRLLARMLLAGASARLAGCRHGGERRAHQSRRHPRVPARSLQPQPPRRLGGRPGRPRRMSSTTAASDFASLQGATGTDAVDRPDFRPGIYVVRRETRAGPRRARDAGQLSVLDPRAKRRRC